MKVAQRVQWESHQTPGRYFKGIIRRLESEYRAMDYPLIEIPGRAIRRLLSFVAFPVLENTWAIVEADVTGKLEPVKLCRLVPIGPPTWKKPIKGGSATPNRVKNIGRAA